MNIQSSEVFGRVVLIQFVIVCFTSFKANETSKENPTSPYFNNYGLNLVS